MSMTQEHRGKHRKQETAAGILSGLNGELLDMLRSYEPGPHIWDATSLQPQVFELADKGLIEQVTEGEHAGPHTFQLTALGREVLEAAGDQGEAPEFTCETCGHAVEVSRQWPGAAPEHVNPEDDDHPVVVAEL